MSMYQLSTTLYDNNKANNNIPCLQDKIYSLTKMHASLLANANLENLM